jgi:hypothetical protein
MTLLWLDDSRDPFDQGLAWVNKYLPNFHGDIVWVTNYYSFIDWIKKNGLPDIIGFDHDLGDIKTGYDAAKWLAYYCLDNKKNIPSYIVQSSNVPGKLNIESVFNTIKKL